MIVCSNCKHPEPDGAVFCTDCGAQLKPDSQVDTRRFPDGREHKTSPLNRDTGAEAARAWISLHLLDNGQILPISERADFTLGRVSDNQPITPDIDLTEHKAFESGVSRLHAVVRNLNGNIIIMDLGSSNGTYINGVRVPPNIERPIRHGDVVALGKLKIQIILS